MWEPLLCFSYPPGVQIPYCFLSSSFFLLSFVLPGYARIFIVLSIVQGLLLVFSWCSVRIVPSVDVFLMHLCKDDLHVLLLLLHLGFSAIAVLSSISVNTYGASINTI